LLIATKVTCCGSSNFFFGLGVHFRGAERSTSMFVTTSAWRLRETTGTKSKIIFFIKKALGHDAQGLLNKVMFA